jgi:hypothetical protein
MNTTENNKLIAEFLGQNKMPYEFPQFGYIKTNGDWNDTFFDNQLKFHKDWNWLMEVVEKIESLCNNRGFEISSRFVHIRVNNNLTISSGVCSNRIEAVYNACVEFIKWYNTQTN